MFVHIHVLVWTSLMPDFHPPTPAVPGFPLQISWSMNQTPFGSSQASSYTQDCWWAFTPWDKAETSPDKILWYIDWLCAGSSRQFTDRASPTALPVNVSFAFRIKPGIIKSILLERHLPFACAYKYVQGHPHQPYGPAISIRNICPVSKGRQTTDKVFFKEGLLHCVMQ